MNNRHSYLKVLIFVFSSSLYAKGGVTIGLSAGINPDVLHFNSSISKTQIALGDYVDKDNRQNPGNSSIESFSSGALGVPLGINIRYVTSFYLIRFSVINQFAIGGKNTIITNKNSSAKTVVEDYSIRMMEFPLSFAFNIRNDKYTRFYAGAGPSLFFGSVRILHDNGTPNTLADEDIFSGWALGAHLLIGGEVSVSQNISLSMEVIFNFANKSPVVDEAITSSALSTAPQDNTESKDRPQILGVYEFASDNKIAKFDPGYPTGLNFSGFEFMFSINYFVGIL